MEPVDMGFVEQPTTASLSPDGTFVVHCSRGAIMLSPTDPLRTELMRVLDDGERTSELGDVITLAVSPDSSVVAAVYVGAVKFWFLHINGDPQIFDMERRYHETFGHVAFSPDRQHVALGSWEGRITILKTHSCNGSFEVYSHLELRAAIPHLAWSPDGRYLVVSSYAGAKCVDIWQRTGSRG